MAIHTAPTGFVMEQLTQGYNSRQITEKMVLAGLDSTDAAILVQETEVWCTAVVKEQRRKGGRANLLAGGVFLAIGVGIFVGTAYFSWAGGFYIFPTGFVLGGLYYLFRGVSEVSGG